MEFFSLETADVNAITLSMTIFSFFFPLKGDCVKCYHLQRYLPSGLGFGFFFLVVVFISVHTLLKRVFYTLPLGAQYETNSCESVG